MIKAMVGVSSDKDGVILTIGNSAGKVATSIVANDDGGNLSPDEVRVFLESVDEKWYGYFLTAITTGLRLGEVLAMKWSNLDLDKGQYFVRETVLLSRQGRPASIGEPKTTSSIAPVDVTPACMSALKDHKRRQAVQRLKAGDKYRDLGLIFTLDDGGLLDHRNVVRRVYEPALTTAGIRTLRFHDLRHTCASLLIAQAESPKYIQKQLRHASVQITFDRYGHLFEEVNQEAAKRMDAMIFGGAV